MVEDEQVVRIANCANAQPARMAYPGRALDLVLRLLHFTVIEYQLHTMVSTAREFGAGAVYCLLIQIRL
ncbi:GD17378 [Drosophila simulans]|uniref:GD17378 n=1 Tax=Drosophila simulans TaxID=7240 RepID=B4R6R1_DROSI|nr:GD17378 [Drosophila simulans]